MALEREGRQGRRRSKFGHLPGALGGAGEGQEAARGVPPSPLCADRWGKEWAAPRGPPALALTVPARTYLGQQPAGRRGSRRLETDAGAMRARAPRPEIVGDPRPPASQPASHPARGSQEQLAESLLGRSGPRAAGGGHRGPCHGARAGDSSGARGVGGARGARGAGSGGQVAGGGGPAATPRLAPPAGLAGAGRGVCGGARLGAAGTCGGGDTEPPACEAEASSTDTKCLRAKLQARAAGRGRRRATD